MSPKTMSPKAIARNTIWQCHGCSGYYRLPVAIVEGMLPVQVVCPICQHTDAWDKLPIIPKRDISCQAYGTVIGMSPRENGKPPEEIKSEVEEPPLVATNTKLKYSEFQREIQRRMAATLATVKDLRIALADLAHQFTLDCRQELEVLYNLRRWDEMLCEFFFRHPFCMLNYPCADELHSKYARYVLSPRFFQAPYCYDVTIELSEENGPQGGMCLGVVNAYSLTQGMPPLLQKVLALPKPLELAVHGNKIIGADLPWLWQDIPGISLDFDHTDESPSVTIDAQPQVDINKSARVWLARRAVRPWSASPIPREAIDNRYTYQTFFEDNTSLAIWDEFVKCGRLAVFSYCAAQLRSTAMCIAHLLHGIKGVFCATKEQQAMWQRIYCGHFGVAPSMIFCTSDHQHLDIQIQACSAIFLDASIVDEHILIFLRKLLTYSGYVMVIADDPLLDFDEDDEVAALVHATCGWTHQMPVEGKGIKIAMPLRNDLKFKRMLKQLKRQRQGNRAIKEGD